MPSLQRLDYLAQPYRYLVGRHGFEIVKDYVARIGGTHIRNLYLFNDLLLLTKPGKKGTELVKEVIPLANAMRITASNSRCMWLIPVDDRVCACDNTRSLSDRLC